MRTKFIGITLILIIMFTLAIQPLSAAPKTIKVKVTLVSAELVENNHVGNEWWWGSYVNGKELEEGSSVTLTLKSSDTIKLKAEAQEQDKIPEEGAANKSIKVSSVKGTITKSLNVTVEENRGRYSGEQATWKFTFKIQKV
ncbi:hypothetical protein M3223_08135 [Paenibacillus pasadenensis]|uniref:hypothetical protein n=1 Tax=Paenibacillus pasadenensis TaxID=217090 RepID=UPI00203D017F|nr:hypothetical protein [Paenibacillus pasadenensis]MCM3747322.1 hypothetical protein [Paenibacillus pasadenensis]